MKKKGMSGIVTTIIIIGIGLVAVGIIWYVINNIIVGQTEGITFSEKCLKINLKITSANCSSGNCDVLIKRNAGGGDFDGVNLLFYKPDGTSQAQNVSGNIVPLTTVKKQVTGIDTSAEKVEAYAYFIKDNGENQFCSQANPVDIS